MRGPDSHSSYPHPMLHRPEAEIGFPLRLLLSLLLKSTSLGSQGHFSGQTRLSLQPSKETWLQAKPRSRAPRLPSRRPPPALPSAGRKTSNGSDIIVQLNSRQSREYPLGFHLHWAKTPLFGFVCARSHSLEVSLHRGSAFSAYSPKATTELITMQSHGVSRTCCTCICTAWPCHPQQREMTRRTTNEHSSRLLIESIGQ